MAYFPNGTTFDIFYEHNCENCVHEPEDLDDEYGCPIILSHQLFSYELCNQKENHGKIILDLLIKDEGLGYTCNMFHAIEGRNLNPNQLRLVE
jgi:hypothetical protein